MRAWALVLVAAVGCDFQSSPKVEVIRSDSGAPEQAACTAKVAEKLGVPFIRLCPERAGERSFWVSAVPMACSGGEHGTLPCPPVTALVQPAHGVPADFRAPSPRQAAVVEVYTAHKVCTMRFAGRLPTRAERARARAGLGLASVIVTDSSGTRRFRELAEWVTDRPCDQPTDLSPDCNPGPFPSTSISAVPWAMLARCEAKPADPASPLVDLDGACGAKACALRGVAAPSARSPVAGFDLSCLPPDATAEHPDRARSEVAAFRCVLDEWL